MENTTHRRSIKEWPEDERPREKAMLHGISSLSKSELLAILVGSGNDEESAVGLMKRVLASCGDSIAELARLSVDDLCQFRGIGPAKAITIENKKVSIDRSKCICCFCCQEFCPKGAMKVHRTLIAKVLTK